MEKFEMNGMKQESKWREKVPTAYNKSKTLTVKSMASSI